MWLIWDQCRGPARQRQLLAAYVAGAVAASAIAFWRYAHHQQTYYLRYAATGFDPNDFGLILALSVPLALYLMRRERGWLRWFSLCALLVVIPAILLTASRTAMVAAFVAFVFALVTFRAADPAYKVASALAIAALAAGPLLLAPAPQRNRLQTLPAELNRGTFHGRTRIWKTGLKVLKRHPILGRRLRRVSRSGGAVARHARESRARSTWLTTRSSPCWSNPESSALRCFLFWPSSWSSSSAPCLFPSVRCGP